MVAPDLAHGGPRMQQWRNSTAKRVAAAVALPLVHAINRPALSAFGRAVYDIALRFNGMAITFKGKHGLTLSEENFLRQRLNVHDQGVMFDVGANEGAYAHRLRALCPAAQIIAFEPHPATFRTLAANCGGDAIELVNCALGASEGQLELYDFADADGSTQASLSREAVSLFSANVVAHAVTVTTIDSYMHERGVGEIALLKIDTEGRDLDVLRGAQAAIGRRAIAMIQFEFIPANVATRVFMRDFFAALPGYTLYRMCLNGDLLPLGEYDTKRCEIFVVQNLIALRNEV